MTDKLTLKLKDKIVEVTMDDNGRYCLNDLYKASGSNRSKAPQQFLRSQKELEVFQTWKSDKGLNVPCEVTGEKNLTSEACKDDKQQNAVCENFDSYVVQTKVNRATKTFASRKVVFKYTMFIDKGFYEAVVEAFDKLSTGDVQEAANIASSVTLTPEIIAKYQKRYHKLMSLISEKYPDNKYIHSNINRLIGKAVTGYTPKELTGGFDTTVEYITTQGHLPAMNALIATLETITMLIAGGATDYHLIAATLQVKTGKNQSILEMLD